MADPELLAKLHRRQNIIASLSLEEDHATTATGNGSSNGNSDSSATEDHATNQEPSSSATNGTTTTPHMPSFKVFNPYTEYKQFSRKEIKHYQELFNSYDKNADKYIDLNELKFMMEKLGAPQTHIALKNMIKEVDEDQDGKLSFREFMTIFARAREGDFADDNPLTRLASLTEIEVHETGVLQAKDFFQAKINKLGESGKFEAEIRAEQEERKQQVQQKQARRNAFKDTINRFQSQEHA